MDENKELDEELVKETDSSSTPDNPTGDQAKTFSQEDVNRIVKERLAKQSNKFYKALGIENEEELTDFVEKNKKYDELVETNKSLTLEVDGYKKKEVEQGYKSQLKNVDEEFTDLVFVRVSPLENEKVEDYKVRVDAYLEEHPKLKKSSNAIVGKVGTTPDMKGENEDSLKLSLREAIGLK